MADEETPNVPKSGEGRAAAAALNALDNARHDDQASSGSTNVDAAALDQAMKNLSVANSKKPTPATEKTAEVKEKKVVKLDTADVALLVEELEINNAAATKLLRAHDGDLAKTVTAYIRGEA